MEVARLEIKFGGDVVQASLVLWRLLLFGDANRDRFLQALYWNLHLVEDREQLLAHWLGAIGFGLVFGDLSWG